MNYVNIAQSVFYKLPFIPYSIILPFLDFVPPLPPAPYLQDFKYFRQFILLKKDKTVLIFNKICTLHIEKNFPQGLGLEL